MNKKWAYILMVPGLTIIAVFLIVPLLNSIFPTIFDGTSLSLKLYLDFFMDEYNSQIFLRTLRISIATVVVCAVLGVPTAYFVSKTNKKIRGILIACTIFPLLTNSVVRSFAWITILGKNGVLNKVLLALNLISEPQKFLYTEFAVIIGSVYLFLPLMITSLVGVMENIENELLEAAESLGANKITAFFKIVFPLSVPGLIVGSVLVFAGASSAYTTPQMLGGNKNMVLATLIHQQTMTLGNWTQASVIAAIMILTSILVIETINRLAAKLNERGV